MPGPAWIVLPTYCEADNVEPMVRALRAVGPGRRTCSSSTTPRRTAPARSPTALAAADPQVAVLHRAAKRGSARRTSPASTTRSRTAPARWSRSTATSPTTPRRCPRLLDALAAGADLALGSRYVAGGRRGELGAVAARRLARGCAYARAVLRVPVRDLTGGCKAFRAEALETIDFRTARSRGYAFQVELTYRALRAGLRVAELPIMFRERREGESKLSWHGRARGRLADPGAAATGAARGLPIHER